MPEQQGDNDKPSDSNGGNISPSKNYFLGRGPNYQPPPIRDFSEAADPKIEHPASRNLDNESSDLLREAAKKLSEKADKIFGDKRAIAYYDPAGLYFVFDRDGKYEIVKLNRVSDEIKAEEIRREHEAAETPLDAYSVHNITFDENGQTGRSFYFNKEGKHSSFSTYTHPHVPQQDETLLTQDDKFTTYKSPGTMTDFEYASHEIERLLNALTDQGIQIDL